MKRKIFLICIIIAFAATLSAALSACDLFGNKGCGSSHEFGEVIEIKASTCTEEGEGKKVCSVCGYEKRGFVLPKKQHTFGEAEIEEEATCVKKGKESKTCSVCGVKEERVIPQKSHELGGWEIKVEPTCTDNGERVKKCKFCDYEEREKLGTISHDYKETERKEATCEEPGYVKRVCSVCGKTQTEVTERLYHSFPEGTEIKYDYRDNSDENYCYYAYRECARCHKDVFYKTQSHSMKKDAEFFVEATCSSTGVDAKKCLYCNRRTTETIPVVPYNHKRGAAVYGERNAENCTVQATVSCTLCGEEIDSWYEPRHDYDAETFVCTREGCGNVKEMPSSYFTYSSTYLGGWAIKGINDKKTADVKKYIDDNDGRIRLPSRGGYPNESDVKGVLDRVFDALGEEYRAKIKYIYVPSGYRQIFSHAFANLSNLEKITFPKTITKIENYALAGCKNLKELTLPYDSYADIIGIFGANKDNLTGYTLTTLNVYRPADKTTVDFASENCVLFENLITVNIYTEFIGGITYTVDGQKINVSRTVLKNGVDETGGTITYYLK
ncbi:MAG: leucine-rich repeat domain-containing protein [Clostridiales bacterium]|nr:leucine-rich repeat domain-containing protein [Clostridiales bacterium]MDY4655992.1 leucine-rich repeat protein [Eubacteriales bacterium]